MLESLSQSFHRIMGRIKSKSVLSSNDVKDSITEIRISLLEADVNVRVVRRFINRSHEAAEGRQVTKGVTASQEFIKILHDVLTGILGSEHREFAVQTGSVIFLAGLQGSGKTTTVAKLALYLQKQKKTVSVIAADKTRPAATEQLLQLGKQYGFSVFTEGKNAVDTVSRGIKSFKKSSTDVCILDSAGRHSLAADLLTELQQIHSISKPQHTILVADATMGQAAADLAKTFNETIPVSGIILSKCDADSRGGAALSITEITKQHILFLGTGEKAEQFEKFYPERLANRILGMGDVVQLVERAREVVDEEKALALQKKIKKSQFTFNDLLEQISSMKKIGSMQSIINMLPQEMRNQLRDPSAIQKDTLKHQEALILSMTPQERENSLIINHARQKRIAKGAGRSLFEMKKLLKQFEQTKNQMKKLLKKRQVL